MIFKSTFERDKIWVLVSFKLWHVRESFREKRLVKAKFIPFRYRSPSSQIKRQGALVDNRSDF